MLDKKKAPQSAGNALQGGHNDVIDSIAESDVIVNPKAKSRYWGCVMYPENMVEDWEIRIGDLLQGLPYAYCLHHADRDTKSEHRKDHIHLILAFATTTTYKHAMDVFGELNAPGRKAFNTCQQVHSIRGQYDYLIHDTETCKKQGKELYPKEARITGNNFDIGAFEQVSVAEKRAICKELAQIAIEKKSINFADFFQFVASEYVDDDTYFEVLLSYSGFFERLTKGNYQKWQVAQEIHKQMNK